MESEEAEPRRERQDHGEQQEEAGVSPSEASTMESSKHQTPVPQNRATRIPG